VKKRQPIITIIALAILYVPFAVNSSVLEKPQDMLIKNESNTHNADLFNTEGQKFHSIKSLEIEGSIAHHKYPAYHPKSKKRS
jgi:hypothetical protein